MAYSRRETTRQDDDDIRRSIWDKKKAASLKLYKERYGRKITSFDAYGKPLASGDVPSEPVAWRDVRIGLQRALDATGDPLFDDALVCLEKYGLTSGTSTRIFERIRQLIFGDSDLGYLQNMKCLLERDSRRFKSERSAAAEVAAHYFYDASSFDAATQKLRRLYKEWREAGYPSQQAADVGNIGYRVRVIPVSGRNVPLLGTNPVEFLRLKGGDVDFTLYWRHRFRDGDISITRL